MTSNFVTSALAALAFALVVGCSSDDSSGASPAPAVDGGNGGAISNDVVVVGATANASSCVPTPVSSTAAAAAQPPKCATYPMLTVHDVVGQERWGCLVSPPDAGSTPLPLVIFLHPTLGNPVELNASFPFASKVSTADLGGGVKGFHALVPQAQLLEGTVAGRGYAWDASDADLATNHDATAVDALLREVTARVSVDSRRIYLTGWSSGSFFSALYGLRRADIAAIAVYAGAQGWAQRPSSPPSFVTSGCAGPLVAVRRTPFFQVHHTCDTYVPCAWTEDLMNALTPEWPSRDLILDDSGANATACDASCAPVRGTLMHLTWPAAREDEMLAWFRDHPLP